MKLFEKLPLPTGLAACAMMSVLFLAQGTARAETETAEALESLELRLPTVTTELTSWQQGFAMVYSRSLELRELQAAERMAGAEVRQALSKLLPQVTASGSFEQPLLAQTIDGASAAVTLGIGAKLAVVDLKSWAEYSGKRLDRQAAGAERSEARRQRVVELVEATLAVMTAERLFAVGRENLRLAFELEKIQRRQLEMGDRTPLDVARVERERVETIDELLETREVVYAARDYLGLVLGDDRAWGVSQDLAMAPAEAIRTQCTPLRSMKDRADLRAARIRLESARRFEDAAAYLLTPRLNAIVYESYSTNPFVNFTQRRLQVAAGITVEWPLFLGGRIHADVSKARAQTSLRSLAVSALELQADSELRGRQRQVTLARDRHRLAQRRVESEERTLALIRRGLERGGLSTLDLVQSQRSLREARFKVILSELQVTRAEAALVAALSDCRRPKARDTL